MPWKIEIAKRAWPWHGAAAAAATAGIREWKLSSYLGDGLQAARARLYLE